MRGTKRPLPSTCAEKIEASSELKRQGNEAFKAGDFKLARRLYSKVFLYLNGLHGEDSPMRGFFSAMGAPADFGSNETEGNAQDLQIKELKSEANCNLALVYSKLGNPEKSLKHANDTLLLVPGHAKAQFRKAVALSELGRFDESLAVVSSALKADPESQALKRLEGEVGKSKRKANKEANEKEKEMFKGAFA